MTQTQTAGIATSPRRSLLTDPSRPRPPSLDDAAAGRGLLRAGQQDAAPNGPISQLQQQLKDAGFAVTVDGKFGPETEAAVCRFQMARGAKLDGIVGPETMGKLRGTDDVPHVIRDGRDDSTRRIGPARAPSAGDRTNPPSGTLRAGDLANADAARRAQRNASPGGSVPVTLAPAGATEQQRFDHYAAIVRANGGQVCPNGQPTVLGMRGMSRDGTTHDTGSTRRYDDMMIVLTPDGHVRELSGATHPGQNTSTMSPGGNVGMIRPGNYQVVPNGPHAGSASFHVRTMDGSGNLPGWRDTDHNGRFDAGERAASEQRGDTLNGVLFHQGGSSAPTSIGCQTMDPGTYQQFLNAIGGPRASFNYTLVDANR